MAKSGGAANTALTLLVLLGLVGGAGTWNYKRNLAAEAAETRPFRTYADPDLEVLRAAYQAELDTSLSNYERATGRKLKIRDGQMIAEQIAEFERVQRQGRAVRSLAARVVDRQARVEEINAERVKRAGERPAYKQFLRRVFVYRS